MSSRSSVLSTKPDAAQHELRAIFLDDLAADVEVGVLHGGHHFAQR